MYYTIADATWRQGLIPIVRGGLESGAYQIGDPKRLYDTVLEVIDTRAGRVLAARVLDDWVSSVLPDGTAVTASEDAEGNVVLEFLRPLFKIEPGDSGER